MNQKVLQRLFQEDREAAFKQIYEDAFPKVAKFLAQRGCSMEEAKDIFHEALIALYEKCQAESLQIKGSVIPYVVGMSRNIWHNSLRKGGKELLTEDFSSFELASEQQIQPYSASAPLIQLLEKAGKKCLDMLQAVYYFKYSMQELAEEFGFGSTRSATVQKYKCLEKIRAEVKKQENEVIPA